MLNQQNEQKHLFLTEPSLLCQLALKENVNKIQYISHYPVAIE